MIMKRLLTIFLLIFSSTSFSSDWKEFSKTKLDKFYIDKESISKIDSDNFTYWVLRSSLVDNEKIKSVKTKIKSGDVIGLDNVIVATSDEFNELIKELKEFKFSEPPTVKVIESNQIITQEKVLNLK